MRTLKGLLSQTFDREHWELIVVDNASQVPLNHNEPVFLQFGNLKLVREEQLGLTYGRLKGIAESRAEIIIFVDDDNVLAPSYLREAFQLFNRFPLLGACGGKCIPEWQDAQPDKWVEEFYAFLAIRDIGDEEQLSDGVPLLDYPSCAPIGAGMTVRRAAIQSWAKKTKAQRIQLGRKGRELTSGEDNDIVLDIFRAGWQVGYFPQLKLAHLIPSERVRREYLGRLLHGVGKSDVHWRVRHDMGEFKPAARWTVPLRKLRAYWRLRAWAGPAEYVRWCGVCGHFDARAELPVSQIPK
jgi:glycosyltransferase involved in cell wall biosynthesis